MKSVLAKSQFLSSFILKIIAIVSMTLDHVGVLLTTVLDANSPIILVFRIFGRLAFPLFIFMIVEGVLHTKSFVKYIGKIGILLGVVAVAETILQVTQVFPINRISMLGNIYMDLGLCACMVYALTRKEIQYKLLAIVPIAISILSFAVGAYEANNSAIVYWFPACLRLQYGFYGCLLGLLVFAGYKFSSLILEYSAKQMNLEVNAVYSDEQIQFTKNLTTVILVIIATIAYFYIGIQTGGYVLETQLYSIIGGALLLFYNSKRGYNAKWFKYGCYLYYPVHIVILGIIYAIMSL